MQMQMVADSDTICVDTPMGLHRRFAPELRVHDDLSVREEWSNFVEKGGPVPDFRRQVVWTAKDVNRHFVDRLTGHKRDGNLWRVASALQNIHCMPAKWKLHRMSESKLRAWLRGAFSNPHPHMPLLKELPVHLKGPRILKVILIRHAESEENVRFEELRSRVVHGETGGMPLIEALKVFSHKMRDCPITPDGVEMARDVRKQMQARKTPWPRIDAYWHSPLQRTRQTLTELFPSLTHQFEEKPFLREMRPGEALVPIAFKRRVEHFRKALCEVDSSIRWLAVAGHGFFFKEFLGRRTKIENVETMVCDVDRLCGTVLKVETVYQPQVPPRSTKPLPR